MPECPDCSDPRRLNTSRLGARQGGGPGWADGVSTPRSSGCAPRSWCSTAGAASARSLRSWGSIRSDERPAAARQGWANCNQRRLRPLSLGENGLVVGVELRGLEPLTPTLPGRLVGVRRGSPTYVRAGQRTVSSSTNPCERPRTPHLGHRRGTTRRPLDRRATSPTRRDGGPMACRIGRRRDLLAPNIGRGFAAVDHVCPCRSGGCGPMAFSAGRSDGPQRWPRWWPGTPAPRRTGVRARTGAEGADH
jgi:hypothetical protein